MAAAGKLLRGGCHLLALTGTTSAPRISHTEGRCHAAPSDTPFFRARRARDRDFALREPSGAENWISQFQ